MNPRIRVALVVLAPLLAGATGPYKTSAEALEAARRAAERYEAKTACMEDVVRRNAANNREAAEASESVSQLIREKRKALQELAAGYYCSQCGRTASEIERQDRKSFASHLSDVNGHPVPAPASRIKDKAREYDTRIQSENEKLQRYQETWRNFVAEHHACAQERNNAFMDQQSAGNWARFLEAEEQRKATAEAFRKMLEARERERQLREEAQRREQEQRLAEVEREAARLLADYRREQQERRLRLAAAHEALLEAQRNLLGTYTHAEQGSGAPTPPAEEPATGPSTPGLSTLSQVHAEQEANRIADSILTPQESDAPQPTTPYDEAKGAATPSTLPLDEQPRSPLREELQAYVDRATEWVDRARQWRSEVRQTVRQLPGKTREQWQETRAQAYSWLIQKLGLPTQEQLDAMDPLERRMRDFWKVLPVRLIPVSVNPFIHKQILEQHDELIDTMGRELKVENEP